MGEWLILSVLGVLLLNGIMYFMQPGMIFFPWRPLDATPADWELDYEDVAVRTDDGISLHGWYIPRAGARQHVLFLHGNAGNISHRRESIEIFHRLGAAVFIFDYRGYGRSQGSPDEAGLYRDARAAWQYLVGNRNLDPQDIIIFGRSLGGAVAARLASEVTAGGVIIESGFNSAQDLARALFPLLSRLVALRFRFDAAGSLAHTASPVLVLHSPDDEIIPYELGRRLFAAAPEPRRFVALQGGHNTGFLTNQPAYEHELGAFLAAVAAPETPGGS